MVLDRNWVWGCVYNLFRIERGKQVGENFSYIHQEWGVMISPPDFFCSFSFESKLDKCGWSESLVSINHTLFWARGCSESTVDKTQCKQVCTIYKVCCVSCFIVVCSWNGVLIFPMMRSTFSSWKDTKLVKGLFTLEYSESFFLTRPDLPIFINKKSEILWYESFYLVC